MGPVNDFAAELALRFAQVDESEIDDVVVDALQRVARAGAAERAYVAMYHDDGTIEISHEWTQDGVTPHRPALARVPAAEFDYSFQCARRGEVFAIPDVDALPDEAAVERRAFSAFGVRSVLQVPIAVAGEGIGLIGVNHLEPVSGWSEALIDAMKRVGSVIGVVLVRHRSIAGMRRAYEEVARASELKDELLAHVSHELRTPLHAILGYAELLELDPRSARDQDALHQIRNNGRRLLAMVEELIVSGQPQDGSAADVALGPLVEAVLADLGAATEFRHITVSVTDALADATVRARAVRIRQVLYCLLSGALQAVDDGGAIELDAPARHTVRLTIGGSIRAGCDPVTPLASALLDGYGTVATTEDGDTIAVDIRFASATERDDQVARP